MRNIIIPLITFLYGIWTTLSIQDILKNKESNRKVGTFIWVIIICFIMAFLIVFITIPYIYENW